MSKVQREYNGTQKAKKVAKSATPGTAATTATTANTATTAAAATPPALKPGALAVAALRARKG